MSFVRSISVARIASLAYHGTIKLLKSSSDKLSLATAVLRGSFVSVGNAAKLAMAASVKGIAIATGAAAAFVGVVYAVAKAYPKVQEVAGSTLGKMKGWWNENKTAIIDFGKTLYQAIQIGDIAGAFKLAFAGVVKVIGNFAPTIVGALSKITIPVMDLWYSMCQKLE